MTTELEERFQTLHEILKAARQNLAPGAWDYMVGGTETETTVRRNRLALDTIAFRPRVLRNVKVVDASSSLLGQRVRLPVLLAPIGSIESFTPGGAATAAQAAAQFGVPMMLSSACNPGLEATAEAADSFRIYQLYVRGDSAFVDEQVKRALDHGYSAFCLTVDTAWYSRRERDLARRFVKPWRVRAIGQDWQAALSWEDVKRFKDKHAVPLILKGIATAEDARVALEHGVEGVYVSNHGGRQLDHGRGATEVLPEVVAEVKRRAFIMVDGGYLRGTDIVKAMALGADCVGLGRLSCIGLAAAGAAGLVRALELLENEIKVSLGLLGVTRYAELDATFLHHGAPAVREAHALSAFAPLLDEGY